VGDFVSEFPGSRELDRLAAEVSRALQAREALVEARRVLDGVEGPASALDRGYLFLASGAVEEGRAALMQSLAGLPPAESTTTIRLVSLLGRMGDQVARVLARAAWEARRGAVEQAFELLERGLEEAAPATRADLLAHGARMAEDAGAADRAAQARTRLLEEHPDAAAVSEAALALARYHANRENEVQTAIDILEALIAERPDDPIVPNARLELSRLRGTP